MLNGGLELNLGFLLGFFPLLSMISRGSVWNYQQPEGHCPVKPWLRLLVVSLFILGTINKKLPAFLPLKQTGLTLASNGQVARSQVKTQGLRG